MARIWKLFSLKEEGNTAICNNADKTGGHHAEEITRRERKIYYLTYMWNRKYSNS